MTEEFQVGKLGRQGMLHLNGNILAAIDVETTGLVPGFNDIVQICVLPLDADIKPLKMPGLTPFYMDLQPKRPENVDPEVLVKQRQLICDATIRGMEAYAAADLLMSGFKS